MLFVRVQDWRIGLRELLMELVMLYSNRHDNVDSLKGPISRKYLIPLSEELLLGPYSRPSIRGIAKCETRVILSYAQNRIKCIGVHVKHKTSERWGKK
jgi:hypothetical protein